MNFSIRIFFEDVQHLHGKNHPAGGDYARESRELGMREIDMKEIKISVLLADDHPGMISGIKHELSPIDSIHLKSSVSNSTELIERLEAEYFDVLVSDYSMPAGGYGDGLALFGYISRRFPNLGLVILTMLDNPAIYRSLAKIIKVSIVSKSDSLMHLLPAIHAAYTGGIYHSPAVMARMDKMVTETGLEKKAANFSLSPRESEVLRLYASGLRIDDIAAKLSRSKKTISAQKIKAMQKLGIERDIELMKYALECGWTGSSETE